MSNDRRLRRAGGRGRKAFVGMGSVEGWQSGLEIVQMNFRPLAYFVCISVLLGKERSVSLSLFLSLSFCTHMSASG